MDFTINMHPASEMLPLERKTLYSKIAEFKPRLVFEVGTGIGYGSTYYIAKAIKDHNLDTLVITCDPSRSPDESFKSQFPFVTYLRKYSNDVIDTFIQENNPPDFLMFDGPDDAEVTINDLLKLEKIIKPKCKLCIHDYETGRRGFDGAISNKCAKIRPYLESSNKWTEVLLLSGVKKNSDEYDMPFDSVGFAIFEYNPK